VEFRDEEGLELKSWVGYRYAAGCRFRGHGLVVMRVQVTGQGRGRGVCWGREVTAQGCVDIEREVTRVVPPDSGCATHEWAMRLTREAVYTWQ
jgi:hypothetical protein